MTELLAFFLVTGYLSVAFLFFMTYYTVKMFFSMREGKPAETKELMRTYEYVLAGIILYALAVFFSAYANSAILEKALKMIASIDFIYAAFSAFLAFRSR